jgi:hypothetical protein
MSHFPLSLPGPGGAGNSCPVFLGSCSDPTSVWDDSQGVLANVRYGPDSAINIDCDSGAPHAVAKCLDVPGGSGNPITCELAGACLPLLASWHAALMPQLLLLLVPVSSANGGQLVYAVNSGATMCLNGGQGPVTPPCNSQEPFIEAQVNIDDCSAPTTSGWARIPAQ